MVDAKGMKILVVGLGVTGRACAEALPGLGAEVIVTDARSDLSGLESSIEYVRSKGAEFVEIAKAGKIKADALVVSPGLAPADERIQEAIKTNGGWMSEIELGRLFCKGKIFAVTGTNGKSTAVTMAGGMLAKKYADVRVSGNIGEAFIKAVIGSDDSSVHVVELSSYQLEGCEKFRPHVGAVLNVREDHKARHPSLKEYAAAKARMLRAMEKEDMAILCSDDELVMGMAAETRAGIACFSVAAELDEGAFLRGGSLVVRRGGSEVVICQMDELPVRGPHNAQNALATSLGALKMGVEVEKIREALIEFKNLRHRVETVGFVNGVECVNDSKGTNVDSVIAALKTFEGRDITLLLGGDDKGFDYAPLYEEIRRRGVSAIVIGEALKRVADEIEKDGTIALKRVANMKQAVSEGCASTPRGGVLLLSPSSSSFDMYRNFEERGVDFENEVKSQKNG